MLWTKYIKYLVVLSILFSNKIYAKTYCDGSRFILSFAIIPGYSYCFPYKKIFVAPSISYLFVIGMIDVSILYSPSNGKVGSTFWGGRAGIFGIYPDSKESYQASLIYGYHFEEFFIELGPGIVKRTTKKLGQHQLLQEKRNNQYETFPVIDLRLGWD